MNGRSSAVRQLGLLSPVDYERMSVQAEAYITHRGKGESWTCTCFHSDGYLQFVCESCIRHEVIERMRRVDFCPECERVENFRTIKYRPDQPPKCERHMEDE